MSSRRPIHNLAESRRENRSSDGRLIFAGEHTSGDFSGFMNGAVQSGNRAAKEILEPEKIEVNKAA